MRIRLPFLGAFFTLLLLAAYAGLSTLQLPNVNDKVLHTVTFFLLTLVFYWILDTTRRRNLNLTLITCTGILGVGSEFLQAAIPNGRQFDPYDIVANIIGSLVAVGGCAWYHKRMLERKRAKRGYGLVGQGDELEGDDVELGESSTGAGLAEQESGVTVPSHVAPLTTPTSLEAEVDGWDENQIDDEWDEDVPSGEGDDMKTPSASSAREDVNAEIPKKRVD